MTDNEMLPDGWYEKIVRESEERKRKERRDATISYAVAGAILGYLLHGFGGAILGAPIGAIVGYYLGFLVALFLILLFLAIYFAAIYGFGQVVAHLWNVRL